jgi:hypothetical protein
MEELILNFSSRGEVIAGVLVAIEGEIVSYLFLAPTLKLSKGIS